MGNRAHEAMLNDHPWLRRKMRGCHADGPQVWIKRKWSHRLRQTMRRLLRRDPDKTVYPLRMGDRWEWY